MTTLRIVLEFEQDEVSITPSLLEKFWSHAEGDKEQQEMGLESELALLAAIKTQPQMVRKLWLEQAVSWMQWLENRDVIDLISPVYNQVELKPFAAELKPYAREYFIKEGMLNGNDHELLTRWVLDLRLRAIKVEDVE